MRFPVNMENENIREWFNIQVTPVTETDRWATKYVARVMLAISVLTGINYLHSENVDSYCRKLEHKKLKSFLQLFKEHLYNVIYLLLASNFTNCREWNDILEKECLKIEGLLREYSITKERKKLLETMGTSVLDIVDNIVISPYSEGNAKLFNLSLDGVDKDILQ